MSRTFTPPALIEPQWGTRWGPSRLTPATVFGELTADGRHVVIMALGEYQMTARAWRQLSELTPKGTVVGNGMAVTMPLSWPLVTQLACTFGSAWTMGGQLHYWMMGELARRTQWCDKPLRYQLPAELALKPYQPLAVRMLAHNGCLLEDEPRLGKAQPLTTPIYTPNGWTAIGELQPGDIVFNGNGVPARVRQLHGRGQLPVYRVTLNDRTSTLATGDHLWKIFTVNDRKRGAPGRVLTTNDMRTMGCIRRHASGGNASQFFLPPQPIIQYGITNLPLDPYTYGALLGDGSLSRQDMSITCPDDDILKHVARTADDLGTSYRWQKPMQRCQALIFHRNGLLRGILAELGACTHASDKRVHQSYLFGDETVRRNLLAGLLDTDGHALGEKIGLTIEFSSASPQLTADVAFLARSLGAVAMEASPKKAGYTKNGIYTQCQDTHRVHLRFPVTASNPFILERKANVWATQAKRAYRKSPPRSIISIEPEGTAEVACIELDTNDPEQRLYLTDTALIPTHNTVTTIVGLCERQQWPEYPPVLPIVVVCPASVVTQWVREFQLWAPHWRTVAWRGGNKDSRRELIGAYDVYVGSYAIARGDAKAGANLRDSPLAQIRPATVIADEYHWLSNPNAQQTRATQRLARKANLFVPLSGTPFTHNFTNMQPTLEVFEHGAFDSAERMAKRYCIIEEQDYSKKIHGLRPDNEAELRASFLGRQIRRTREDVAEHLGKKTYSTRFVQIPPKYAKMYRDMELRMIAELDDGQEVTPMATITKIQRLQQLSASACDLTKTYSIDEKTGLDKEHQHLHPRLPSWKIEAMLDVLAELSWPALAFGISRPLVVLAGEAAEEAGARVGYIVGGQTHRVRDRYKDDFQAGKLDLLCVVVEAGGTGLTLNAAGTEIFLQRPYSFVNSTQAEDRAVGDRYPTVDIVDIYAELPDGRQTIDQRIRHILLHKAAQLSEYFQDPRLVRTLFGGDSVPRKVA